MTGQEVALNGCLMVYEFFCIERLGYLDDLPDV